MKLLCQLFTIWCISFLSRSFGAAPDNNGTSVCNTCGGPTATCSLLPNVTAGQPDICYQGYSNETQAVYAYDTDAPYPMEYSCDTCSSKGFKFFVSYDLLIQEVGLWSPQNPLCALAAATNIPSLVGAGSMTGWDCEGPGLYTSQNYCSGWTGVTCDNSQPLVYPQNMTITEISLPSLGIWGTLPSQLSELFYVTTFDLSDNAFSDTQVPSSIGGMYNLQHFNLAKNKFTGPIPTAIGLLSQLNTLQIQNNEFEGIIPTQVGYLAMVTSMNMSNNVLTGSIPYQLCSDQLLSYLNVENNNLRCYDKCVTSVGSFYPGSADSCYDEFVAAEGPALCALYAATNIPQLVDDGIIGGWKCTDDGEAVGDFCDWFGVYCGMTISDDPAAGFADDIIILNTTVYELNLPALGITGSLPSELSALSYLLVINMKENNLTGSIPNEYGSLIRMAGLYLGDNSLSGTIPSSLVSWNDIQEMELYKNNFTGSIPPSFGDHYSLGFLLVNENNFKGAIPQEICNDTGLNTFDFSANPLLTCYPNCLTSVPNLINGNNISKCNYVELPPLSEQHKIFIIVGTIVGACCLLFVLLYVFAKKHIMWLIGEVQDLAERFSEEASSLISDLDFSDIRASTVQRPHYMQDEHDVEMDNPIRGDVSMKTMSNPIFSSSKGKPVRSDEN